MELTSPKTIKEILSKCETKPSKKFGQNFLIDKNILEKIIKSADIKPDDIVLEVGPGTGALTQELAKKSKKVIAVEKDPVMIKILSETLTGFKNVEIINGDILKLQNLKIKNYKVVANIPYYITAPLIRKFLEEKNQPLKIILMVQKEVAQRICSRPPDMSLLSVSVQFYAEPEIISYVPKNCFLPAPKIDSAIIKIVPKNKYNVDPKLFFEVVKAGFLHPRKQLVNNLTVLKSLNGVKLDKSVRKVQDKSKIYNWLLKNKINPSQRAETLSIENWISLAKNPNF